jgi:hypothetical protein
MTEIMHIFPCLVDIFAEYFQALIDSKCQIRALNIL